LIVEQPKHVIIASRSVEKDEVALEQLRSMGHPGTVEMLHLQVADPASVTDIARIVENKYGRYVMVNNAGQAVAATGTA
jgi:NADP-dependent 3-hydroxy acid dehydrogenase YdfG